MSVEVANVHIPICIVRSCIWIVTEFPLHFNVTGLRMLREPWMNWKRYEGTCHLFQRITSAFGWRKSGTTRGTYFRTKVRNRDIQNVPVFTFIMSLATPSRVLHMACNLLLNLQLTSSQAVSKTVWHIPLLCVQWKTPDDGQRNCPKHVEFHSKNKFEKLVHLVGFIIRKSFVYTYFL
jgi:hypothetical protein